MTGSDHWKHKLQGLAVCTALRGWMRTIDHQFMYYDSAVDPAREHFAGPMIYVFWHEYIASPVYIRPNCQIAMLVSRHRDAQWLSSAARFMGHTAVRGSSKRGGDVALRELTRKGRRMNVAITPDGPRGPRRQLASGCIYLASRLQMPLVAVGVGYDRPWRLRTWDHFAMPRPFSRARLLFGPPLRVPAKLSREGIESQRLLVERVLNQLTCEAEAWAESGERRPGQVGTQALPAPLLSQHRRTLSATRRSEDAAQPVIHLRRSA